MTDEPVPGEERYADLFAAAEDALAAGGPAEGLCPDGIPPEERARLERVLACVRLLRETLARPPGPAPTFSPPPAPPQGPLARTVAPAPGPRSAGELQGLLRRRLRFIALAITAHITLGVLLVLHTLVFHPQLLTGGWTWWARLWVVYLTMTGVTGLLWTQHPFSLRQLRGMEVLIFGLILASEVVALGEQLFVERRLRPYLHIPSLYDEGAWNYLGPWLLIFFALIVSYGTLVPSTWRRCTVMVGGMALAPLTLFTVAGLMEGGALLGPLGFLLLVVVFWLAFACGIAIYGAHRVEVLRQEASEARKLGPYQLKRLLGAGGMGEVYLAEHVLLKQPCALKLIRPERAGDPATLRRFEREVQATARLKHWNTVQIFDYGHAADGTFYYVMEYLSGLTLEQLVARYGALPPARTVYLLRQACRALREAHALGLVHRDLKPANIMLCSQGGVPDLVKLLDFGLVKPVGLDGHDDKLTQEGVIAGTPAYLSPEQAAGHEPTDAPSDIYSLGAVAYFLLAGHPPFPRDRAIQMIVAHIHEPVPPLGAVRPEVPADLQAVVARCLEKDPARRFADAGALEHALAGCHCAGEWTEDLAAHWWQTEAGAGAAKGAV